MSNKYDIEIKQGSVFRRSITYKDSTGALVNLTGYTARMQVRPKYTSVDKLVDITSSPSGHGSITLGGVAGTIVILIHSAHTATLDAPAKAVWDLELVEPGGEADRILEGAVVITPEVTK
jgi:hypothetical protein